VAGGFLGVKLLFRLVLDSVMAAIFRRQIWQKEDFLVWKFTYCCGLLLCYDKQVILVKCVHDIPSWNIKVYKAFNRICLLHGADWRTLQKFLRDNLERKRRSCLLLGNYLLLEDRQALVPTCRFWFFACFDFNSLYLLLP